MTVGEKIRRYRRSCGMTQQELGEALGVGKAAVQKYESGQVQNLKTSHITTLSELFNAPPWEFIFDDDEIEGKKPSYEIQLQHGDGVADIIRLAYKMNEAGLRKIIDYANDIVRISDYASKVQDRS